MFYSERTFCPHFRVHLNGFARTSAKLRIGGEAGAGSPLKNGIEKQRDMFGVGGGLGGRPKSGDTAFDPMGSEIGPTRVRAGPLLTPVGADFAGTSFFGIQACFGDDATKLGGGTANGGSH